MAEGLELKTPTHIEAPQQHGPVVSIAPDGKTRTYASARITNILGPQLTAHLSEIAGRNVIVVDAADIAAYNKTTGEIDTPKTRRQLFVFMEKSGGLKAPEETWPDVTTRLMPDILARKQFSDETFVDSRGVKSCLITLGNPDATPYEMAVQLSGLKNANLINIGGTSASWFRYVAIHESTHCAPGNLVITHGPILDNMGITLAGEIRSDLAPASNPYMNTQADRETIRDVASMRALSAITEIRLSFTSYAGRPVTMRLMPNTHATNVSLGTNPLPASTNEDAAALIRGVHLAETMPRLLIGHVLGPDYLSGLAPGRLEKLATLIPDIESDNHEETYRKIAFTPESFKRDPETTALAIGDTLAEMHPKYLVAATRALYEFGAYAINSPEHRYAAQYLKAVDTNLPDFNDGALTSKMRNWLAENRERATHLLYSAEAAKSGLKMIENPVEATKQALSPPKP